MKSDNLENLFRSKFKEPSSDEMDWLDPSDALFDKAFASFKEEDSDNKPFLWRLATSGVFLILITAGAFFFWNSTEGNTDINQIVSESTVIEDNSVASVVSTATQSVGTATKLGLDDVTPQASNEKSSVNNRSVAISSHESFSASTESVSFNNKNISTAQANSTQNVVSGQSQINGANNSISNRSFDSEFAGPASVNSISDNNNINGQNIGTSQAQRPSTLSTMNPIDIAETAQSNISILPVLTIEALTGMDIQLPVLQQALIVDNDIEDKFRRSKSISLSGGRNYSSISHNTTEISHLLELGGNQELQGGWSVGLDFRTDLDSKWTLIGGVSLNRINMQAWTNSISVFYSRLASVNAGQRVFNTDVGFVSPTTSFRDNAEFIIENVAIEDGDLFDHNMRVNQDISIVSANVGIGRRLIQSNRFSVSSELSVGLDYISRIQENLNLEVKFEDNLVYQKQSDWVNHNGINRVGANVGLNIRAEWELSDRFDLFVSPSYKRSLTSIKNSEIIQTRSFYNLYNLSTGISLRF